MFTPRLTHCMPKVDWTSDCAPRGRYLESLNMSSRHSDISILEAVQILAFLKLQEKRCKRAPVSHHLYTVDEDRLG